MQQLQQIADTQTNITTTNDQEDAIFTHEVQQGRARTGAAASIVLRVCALCALYGSHMRRVCNRRPSSPSQGDPPPAVSSGLASLSIPIRSEPDVLHISVSSSRLAGTGRVGHVGSRASTAEAPEWDGHPLTKTVAATGAPRSKRRT